MSQVVCGMQSAAALRDGWPLVAIAGIGEALENGPNGVRYTPRMTCVLSDSSWAALRS